MWDLEISDQNNLAFPKLQTPNKHISTPVQNVKDSTPSPPPPPTTFGYSDVVFDLFTNRIYTQYFHLIILLSKCTELFL